MGHPRRRTAVPSARPVCHSRRWKFVTRDQTSGQNGAEFAWSNHRSDSPSKSTAQMAFISTPCFAPVGSDTSRYHHFVTLIALRSAAWRKRIILLSIILQSAGYLNLGQGSSLLNMHSPLCVISRQQTLLSMLRASVGFSFSSEGQGTRGTKDEAKGGHGRGTADRECPRRRS